jgi:hypothetical protein
MSMDFRLEVVPIPVSEVDLAKRFYSEQAGFVVDLDTRIGDEMRLVQLTPARRGVRLFEHLGTTPIELERTRVIEVPDVTHLTFRVVK